jgi:ABC-type sugar transport system substrate-binding protein
MQKCRIIVALLLAVAVAMAFAAGSTESAAAGTKEYRIAYIPTSVGQPATNAWQEGMERVLRKHSNVKFQVFDPQLKAELQVAFMDDAINQKFHAIALQPVDAAALSAAVRQAEAAGIIVITINTATIQAHTASVQMADITLGQAVAKVMGEQLGGKGNVAIIQSPPGAIAGVNREKGFRQGLAEMYPNIKIVGAQSAEGWRKEIAITIMNSFLQANQQLDGVFAVNDNMAEGAMIAAEAAGRLSQIKIWGANGQKSTLELIEQGKIAGTSYNDCFAQGGLIATMMLDRLDKNLGPSKSGTTEIIQIPPFPATKQTVGQIPPENRW